MGYANKSSVIAFLIMSSLATCLGASPMEEKIVTALEMRKEGIKWSEIFGDKIKPSAK